MVDFDLFGLEWSGRCGTWSLWKFLLFTETNRLGHSVLGDKEVLRAQAFDRIPFLVFDHHRLDDQLTADGDLGIPVAFRPCILPCLLRSNSQRPEQQCCENASHVLKTSSAA